MNKYLVARPLAIRMGDLELQTMIASNIASLYFRMGSFELAQAEAERALGVLKSGVPPMTRAGLTAMAASTRAKKGDIDSALPLFHAAINLMTEGTDPELEAQIWSNLGSALREANRLGEAEDAFTQELRLRIMRRGGNPAIVYGELGELRLDQGQPEAAERFLTLAIENSRSAPTSLPNWWNFYCRGLAKRAQSHNREALADFRAARELVRLWRLEVLPVDSLRVNADVELHNRLYMVSASTAAALYLSTKRPGLFEESFLAAEENRAASLRESLVDLPRRLPDEYWETLARLRSGAAAGAKTAVLDGWRLKLVELETQAGSPGTGTGSRSEHSLEAVQRRLGPDDCLLTFHLGKDESFRWAVTRSGYFLERLIMGQEIPALARQFTGDIREGRSGSAQSGARLYHALFGGLPARFRAKRNWKLVLDDCLFGVPFAALIVNHDDGRPAYLVKDHELEILPNVLMVSPAANPRMRLFAGFGDAIYNRADNRMAQSRRPVVGILQAASRKREGIELNRLIGSGTEVESCARVWSVAGMPQMVATGRDVSRAKLQAALQASPAVLHLATHVVPVPDDRKGLALAFGLKPDGGMELLSTSEIANMHGDAGVVTLSGCESGGRDFRPGAGLLGLTRGWLLAGARSVVATYWPVPDDDGELFRQFYSRLGVSVNKGRDFHPAGALRGAQLEILHKSGFHTEPRFWAAYFAVSRGLPE